jgi:hypothetical protein
LNWSAKIMCHRGEEEALEHSPDSAPPLVAAPRHLRRRRLHGEIPDSLLVPGAEPIPLEAAPAAASPYGQEPSNARSHAAVSAKRKRTAALIVVILVSLSIPALVLALVFSA